MTLDHMYKVMTLEEGNVAHTWKLDRALKLSLHENATICTNVHSRAGTKLQMFRRFKVK